MTDVTGTDRDGSPSVPLVVRRALSSDARRAAVLHTDSIADGFLSSLGRPFLRRLYRRASLSPAAFLLVTDDHRGAPAGFVAGALDTGRFYRDFLLLDGAAVALQSGPRLLLGLPRVFETLRYGAADNPRDEAELLALAVDERHRGSGRGGTLVGEFLDVAAGRGATSARVVVGAANRTAITVYERAGFVPVRQLEVHRGTPSLLMRAPTRRGVT